MQITVSVRAGETAVDLELSCAPDRPAREAIRALLRAARVDPDQDVLVDGHRVDLGSPAGEAVRQGCALEVGEPPAPAVAPPALTLHAVGGRQAGASWPLPPGEHGVGRDPRHRIQLAADAVSRSHANLLVQPEGTTIVDRGSTNGLWARGQRVSSCPLTPHEPVRVGGTALALRSPEDPPLLPLARSGRLEVNRAPRVQPATTAVAFTLPQPPAERPAPRLPWLAMAGPLVVGVALAFLMDPRFLLFSLLSPVMAGGQALADRWHHKKEVTRTTTAHRQALEEMGRELAGSLEAEGRRRRAQSPDPALLQEITARPTARLWERRPHDADWLELRLGLARLPSAVTVEGEPQQPHLDDVPLTVRLPQHPVLGLAGPEPLRRQLGEWLLAQACALHSPRDLQVAVLASDPDRWQWTRWLPHLLHGEDVAATVAAVRASAKPVLVVVDGARRLRALPGVADLLSDLGPHAVICLDERAEDLPGECSAVAVLLDQPVPRLDLSAHGAVPVVGALPDLVVEGWTDRVARSLAPLLDATPEAGAAGLPAEVGWVGPADADELLTRWARPTTRVVLGTTTEGPWEVDLAVDGPHALVAGTTGSGKSEALRALVAGLAAANPPDALAFVLIDYKGGAAFGACAQLPHVAGMVTDLDPALTERALASLSAELRRREQLLAQAGVDDLRDYPNDVAGLQSLSRLVIVVDEFASLAEELPDFVGGLVGIAQRGRSHGVPLVLATQRPEGCVSADIRANTALRLCLAVNRDSESRAVVGAPVAALIPPGSPGRGYARTGSGPLRPVQVARVTAPVAAGVGDVTVVRRAWMSSTPPPASEDAPHALDLLVAAAAELVRRGAVQSARSPWLPPLPHPEPARGDVWAVADLPERQCIADVRTDLAADGHLLVVGAPRSGRTTAARAFVHALAGSRSADQVHVYAVDDSGSLADLAELPHCGAVVRAHDTDRLVRLIAMLGAEVARRRDIADASLPELVLVVDRWDSAVDALEQRDGGRWVDALHGLVTDGVAAGLHVVAVVSGRAPSGRLSAAVDRKLVLRLADPSDVTMFGIPLRSVPAELPTGRGFLVDATGSRLAQVVRPAPLSSLLPAMAPAVDLPPRRVDALPTSIDVECAEALRRKPRPERRACVLLGVGGDELAPVDLDVVDVAPAFVVAGPPRSGRSTALSRIVSGLVEEGVQVAALLPRSSPLARVPGIRVLSGDESIPPPDHVLVCDDVELAGPGALALLEAALLEARDGGPTVLLAGTTDDLAVGFRGPVVEARRSRCGLILAPRSPHDGELLGVRLPQPGAGEPPPGRGALVLRGTISAIQVVQSMRAL
jgi:S-DNA-T family DNA segregation ATPase FtsK/SpoIIIE